MCVCVCVCEGGGGGGGGTHPGRDGEGGHLQPLVVVANHHRLHGYRRTLIPQSSCTQRGGRDKETLVLQYYTQCIKDVYVPIREGFSFQRVLCTGFNRVET